MRYYDFHEWKHFVITERRLAQAKGLKGDARAVARSMINSLAGVNEHQLSQNSNTPSHWVTFDEECTELTPNALLRRLNPSG